MTTFKLHTLASAPVGSLPTLEVANKEMGFIPNLYAHLASSPVTLEAYKQLGALLEKSAFSQKRHPTLNTTSPILAVVSPTYSMQLTRYKMRQRNEAAKCKHFPSLQIAIARSHSPPRSNESRNERPDDWTSLSIDQAWKYVRPFLII